MKHIILIAILSLLIGCSSVETEWKKTKTQISIESLEAFLKEHPEGDFADSAHLAIDSINFYLDSIRFSKVAESNTAEALYEYLNKHWNEAFSDSAKGMLLSLAAKQVKKDTFSVLDAYIITTSSTNKGYLDIIDSFPQTELADIAGNELDQNESETNRKIDSELHYVIRELYNRRGDKVSKSFLLEISDIFKIDGIFLGNLEMTYHVEGIILSDNNGRTIFESGSKIEATLADSENPSSMRLTATGLIDSDGDFGEVENMEIADGLEIGMKPWAEYIYSKGRYNQGSWKEQ